MKRFYSVFRRRRIKQHDMSTLWNNPLWRGWRWSLIAVLTVESALSVVGTPQAGAAVSSDNALSMAEIRTRLRQQCDQIRNLYLETTIETTSPLKAEELRTPPPHSFFFSLEYMGQRVEESSAFKGAKLYYRVRYVPRETWPVEGLRGDATELEKAVHEARMRGNEEYRRLEANNPEGNRIKQTFEDTMIGFNERAVWFRHDRKYQTSDGKDMPQPPAVFIFPPDYSPPVGYIFPVRLLFQAGLASPAKRLGPAVPEYEQAVRENFLPDLLDAGTYSVSGNVETLDGARCLVLEGGLERTVQLYGVDGQEQYTTHDQLWLDLDRGLGLRKREWTSTPGSHSRYIINNSDFREIVTGVWLPFESEFQEIASDDPNDYPEAYRGKAVLVRNVKVTKCIVNEVPDDLFDVLTKPGDMIQDRRY